MIDNTFFESSGGQVVANAICTIMERSLTARQKQVHILVSREGCSTAEAALELGVTAVEVRADLRAIKTCLAGLDDYLAQVGSAAAKNRATRVVRKTPTNIKGTFMPAKEVWAASDDVVLEA